MGFLFKVFLFLGLVAGGAYYMLGEEDRTEMLGVLGASGRAVASDTAASVSAHAKELGAEAAPLLRARAAEIVLQKK